MAGGTDSSKAANANPSSFRPSPKTWRAARFAYSDGAVRVRQDQRQRRGLDDRVEQQFALIQVLPLRSQDLADAVVGLDQPVQRRGGRGLGDAHAVVLVAQARDAVGDGGARPLNPRPGCGAAASASSDVDQDRAARGERDAPPRVRSATRHARTVTAPRAASTRLSLPVRVMVIESRRRRLRFRAFPCAGRATGASSLAHGRRGRPPRSDRSERGFDLQRGPVRAPHRRRRAGDGGSSQVLGARCGDRRPAARRGARCWPAHGRCLASRAAAARPRPRRVELEARIEEMPASGSTSSRRSASGGTAISMTFNR